MAEESAILAGFGGGGLAIGFVVTRYYPQKYWLPWLMIIAGGGAGGLVAGFITYAE